VLGFQTHRDDFAIAFTKADIELRISDLRGATLTTEAIEERYFPPGDDEGEKDRKERLSLIKTLRESVRGQQDWKAPITLCAYRPFDERWCYFAEGVMDRPRRELIDNVVGRDNIQLIVPRQIGTATWRHAFIAQAPANDCLISDKTREANYVFPLYLYPKGSSRRESLSGAFRAFLDARYDHHYTPEEILGYIYAVLQATTYRTRYAEFLRIDFPRIPFPETRTAFDALSKLGWALVQAHLLRKLPRKGLAEYHGKGEHEVEGVRYDPKDGAVWINETQYFKPVPQAVWDFHIGGYQVIDKYLKSRKGRKLELDEINHVAAVADALAFTIEQMAKIDEAYRAAFPDRG
jgi:predicted helicase